MPSDSRLRKLPLFLVAVVALAAAIVAWYLARHRHFDDPDQRPEGQFGGRSVAQWDQLLQKSINERDQGITNDLAALGPDAVPLLSWLGRNDGTLEMKLTHRAAELIGPSILSDMGPALHSKDPDQRLWALGVLGLTGEDAIEFAPDVANLLREGAAAKDRRLMDASGWVLGEMGAAAGPELVKLLDDPATRTEALHVLRAHGLEAVPLIDGVRDTHPDLAEAALQLAAMVRTEQGAVVPYGAVSTERESGPGGIGQRPISRQSGMDSELVRRLELQNLTVDEAVEKLGGYLSGADSMRQRRAMEAIRRLGSAARMLVPQIVQALQSEDQQMQWDATLALGSMPDEALPALPWMIAKLGDASDPTGRNCAMWAIGEIGPPAREALGPLAQIFHDKSWDVWGIGDRDRRRTQAAISMAMVDPPAAVPHLMQELDEPRWFVRHGTIDALAFCGPAALDTLRQALEDPNRRKRRGAAVALLKMGDRLNLAYVVLARQEGSSDEFVRWAAGEAQRQFHRAAP